MENQLIEVPDWNPKELNLVLSVRVLDSDGLQLDLNEENFIFPEGGINNKKNFELQVFYSDFICDNSLKDLFLLIDTKYPKILNEAIISKFMSESTKCKEYNTGKKLLKIEVDFVTIREQITSYLELKIGLVQEVKKLKEYFIFKNNLSFTSFINKKSKFLANLNLEDYINQLNNQTNKKISNRLNKEIKGYNELP